MWINYLIPYNIVIYVINKSLFLKKILPLTIEFLGDSLSIDIIVWVFPEPDSPIIPINSPLFTDKFKLNSTCVFSPILFVKYILRFLISNMFSLII